MEIEVIKAAFSRVDDVDFDNIPFGKIFSDHMFVVDFLENEWMQPTIMPYGNLEMSPAISALHYGQAIFEGMKAYKGADGRVRIFRPFDNIKRMNKSAERMCMAQIPESLFMDGLTQMLSMDSEWVPSQQGCSLYIRPVMFATTAEIKVKTADQFKFVILTCPVGPYYPHPVKVVIEEHYSRAAEGGVGSVKAAGNYGAALYPAKLAQEKGFDQLLWTDAKDHKYIEESGTMNVIFVLGNKLVTPSLEKNTILSGITRDSVLTLAKELDIEVEERKILVEEIIDGCKTGELKEAFGAGTAATIAPIDLISYEGIDFYLPSVDANSISSVLLKMLTDIRVGKSADTYDWMHLVG
ncbi:MAG TPA: branched-chain amino acid aminotransferase [Flavobacteriales bacterium]|nr:branched-chain amino acid aminotransferase [Flavobacteriales bacterium]HIA10712.1 branched-chain amino acid aminotransferase [Flavobacteriales bacterium]